MKLSEEAKVQNLPKTFKEIFDGLTYGSNVVARKENFVLTRPRNVWDFNYDLHGNTDQIIECA